jgi:uncharacterized protein (TIGR03437 family)
MRALPKGLLVVFVVLAMAAPMAAADLLFVFRGDTAQAAVYDAGSLRLLASPSVGFEAAEVFGIPDSRAVHGFAKFFVVGRDAVVVLDGEFQVRRSLALSDTTQQGRTQGRNSAVLAAAGSRLLVASGSRLSVIDTAEEQVVRSTELPFPVRALASVPRPERVFVVADDSALLRQLNLDSYEIEESAGLMSEPLQDIVAAPSGAWVFGVAGRSFHDLRAAGATSVSSLWESPAVTRSVVSGGPKNVLPSGQIHRSFTIADSGRYVTISGGRVYTGWLSGPSDAAEVTVPQDGGSNTLDAGDIVLSPNGRHLFAASASGRKLLKIDLDQPGAPQTAALSFEPSAVALVSPVAGQTAGMLEQVSPTRQTIAGGKTFTIDVKALNASGSAQSNVTVFASSFNPATPTIECFSDVTGGDGVGSVFCSSSVVTAPRLVRVTVSDTMGRSAPSFEVALVPPTETEGLAKKSGDFEAVPEESSFDLVVSASLNRVPQSELGLVVTPVPGRPAVDCPPQVFTNETGEATITCTTGVVHEPDGPKTPVDVLITVRDATRSVVFTVTIDPNLTISEGLAIVSGDAQRTSNGVEVPFPLVVRSVIDGVPQAGESLAISVSVMRALTCPAQVFTDADGFGFIRCRGGVVFGEETIFVTIGGPRGSQVQFRVIVRATPQGLANDIEILTAEPIEGVVGEVRPNGIRVIATTTGGQRVAGRTVYFSSEDGVTFDPPSAVTDGFGEATSTLTFGCSNRNRGSIEVGFSEDVVEDSIDFNLVPGAFARIDKLQGDNQTGVPGQTLTSAALLVQVGDICGNPLTQQKVNWRVHPEPRATFRNLVDITNQSGRSSVLVQLGNYGGPFTVTAQAGEVMATFNLNVAMEPSQLRRLSGNDQSAAAGNIVAQPLVVEVAGTNGFGVSDVDVAFSVTQGSATLTRPASKTDGLGLAYTAVQMGDGGPVTVTASAVGKSVTFTVKSGSGGGPTAPLAGFVNGASFRPGWIPGSLGSIFGTGITGVNGVVTSQAVPFETTLQGVSVTVNGTNAPIISLINVNGQEQINLQVPFGIQPGTATVVINNNGSSVTIENVPILSAQPGIFEFALDGTLYAAALHADFSVVTPDNPARPGEVILLFVTGLGATNPAVATNVAGPSSPLAQTVLDPSVNLGGADMEDFGGFYAPTLATAYQINFRVAENVVTGNLDIYIVIGGVSSQTSKLPVQAP